MYKLIEMTWRHGVKQKKEMQDTGSKEVALSAQDKYEADHHTQRPTRLCFKRRCEHICGQNMKGL